MTDDEVLAFLDEQRTVDLRDERAATAGRT